MGSCSTVTNGSIHLSRLFETNTRMLNFIIDIKGRHAP